MRILTRSIVAVTALCMAVLARGQTATPLELYIDSIRAIDNHTHVVAPDAEHDMGYDALPCDALPASPVPPPLSLRFGPDQRAAWLALYGFSASSGADAQVRTAHERQLGVRRKQGLRYYEWVLDRAGIDVALANRTVMVSELSSPRFRWVPYDDALLFPLANEGGKAQTPDRKVFFAREEKILEAYLQQNGTATIPPSFNGYLDVVTETLTRQKNGGAVAIKFEAAYLRSLDFAPATREAASAIYNRYHAGGTPSAADYKTLQDFLFRLIASEAGRLGLPVQIHTGNGCGDYFDERGARPMLLDQVLNDPMLRSTMFVLLHGGARDERTIASLLGKPNGYADTSVLELLWSAPELARILRPWLETMPEHVLFGTDAGPWGPGLGWEETTWIGSRKARRALSLALTQMIQERVVTTARAREIATDVLRKNAAALYHLDAR